MAAESVIGDPAPDVFVDLDEEALRQGLEACCGSRRWVDGMMRRRPFGDPDAVLAASAMVARDLEPIDWLEAFSHHPQIGDVEALRVRFAQPQSLAWSRGEQAAVAVADEALLERLSRGNEAYRLRFGYLFIVRAAGRSVAQMVELLENRLRNEPAAELPVAAAQQLEITQLRLEKWLRELCRQPDEVP